MGGLHPGRLLAVRSALASPRQLPGRRRLPHPSRRSPEAATGGCIAAGGRRLAARSALAQALHAPAPPRAACRTAEGQRPATSRPAGGRPHPRPAQQEAALTLAPPRAAHGGGHEAVRISPRRRPPAPLPAWRSARRRTGGRPQPAQHGGRRPWAVAARILVRVSDYSLVFGYPRVSVLGIDFDPN